jgi:hypothetical protein
MNDEKTICPYCKEEIKTDAIKCKHCGEKVGYNKQVGGCLPCIAGLLIPGMGQYMNNKGCGISLAVFATCLICYASGILAPVGAIIQIVAALVSVSGD